MKQKRMYSTIKENSLPPPPPLTEDREQNEGLSSFIINLDLFVNQLGGGMLGGIDIVQYMCEI